MCIVWVLPCCECGVFVCLFFQAEDGIRDLVRSRGLGDVYKRQHHGCSPQPGHPLDGRPAQVHAHHLDYVLAGFVGFCLLYTSDAADERSSVDLGGRRIIKKKNNITCGAVTINRSYNITHAA